MKSLLLVVAFAVVTLAACSSHKCCGKSCGTACDGSKVVKTAAKAK